MSRYVVLIRTDGTVERAEVSEKPTLEELQALVGGYIETVPTLFPVMDKPVMIVNEEGKLKELPKNLVATKCAALHVGDYIAGDAVLMNAGEEDLAPCTVGRTAVLMQLVKICTGDDAEVKWWADDGKEEA